jgi:uncharacterized protein (TIGR02246 family)
MKRTITEIIVEVEETLLMRQTEKNAGSTEETSPTEEIMICPHCGEAIYKKEKINMKNITKNIAGILLTLIFTAIAISAQEKAKVVDTSKDEAEIRANVEQMVKGWNMKSGEEFAKPFAENSDFVVINGTHVKGRAENVKGHQYIFDTIYKDSSLAAVVNQIRFLRPDVALVHGVSTLTAKVNGEERKGSGMITLVMVKNNGKWEIASFQNTAIQSQAK